MRRKQDTQATETVATDQMPRRVEAAYDDIKLSYENCAMQNRGESDQMSSLQSNTTINSTYEKLHIYQNHND